MKEHNKIYYSLEELKRARDCYEGYKDGEEVFYFVGALRYACDEIEKLNNIINKVKQQLLNKKDIVEKSKYFKLVYYTDWNMEHEWDKSIVDKIDEIINIIDEENK